MAGLGINFTARIGGGLPKGMIGLSLLMQGQPPVAALNILCSRPLSHYSTLVGFVPGERRLS
jgi:hypothetical protein